MNTRPKILIVDDRPENLVALRTVLKDLDIELVETTSGNEALKATLHHNFALALLDIQMPEMDGYELAGILREEEKTMNMPFIFISAVYTDNLNVFKGYEKGAFSFITKPFQPEILINKVKFFIDKHQQELALVQLNSDLKSKNEELEAFSYSVSHDLKAPLRSINSYSAILREDYSEVLDAEGNRILNSVIENALKMNKLIDSLLEFSLMGRKEIKKTTVDMNQLLTHVVDEFKNQPAIDNLDWSIAELPAAKGDGALLNQVFVNLISNAVKYSSKKENARIEIGARNGQSENIYFVKDNGVGFNMEYKNKLFGVFQRLHSTNEFQGIGIGLAIVQRVITRHGGQVWAEGEVDKGATFYFSLPN